MTALFQNKIKQHGCILIVLPKRMALQKSFNLNFLLYKAKIGKNKEFIFV